MRIDPSSPSPVPDADRVIPDTDATSIPPGTPRVWPPKSQSRWRGHAGLRTVLYIAGVVLAAGMVFLAGAPGDTGSSPADGHDRSGESQDRPAAGLDKPGQPLDQPIPVPGRHWQGWAHYGSGRCAWLPDELVKRLGATGAPRPTATSCAVPISDGTTLNITWGPPEKRLRWHTEYGNNPEEYTGDLITVAGLEARTTKPVLLTMLFPGVCRVDVNTRSITGLSILVWNPVTAVNGCEIGTTAADLVARARVPAAGGTPWTDTPQQPTLPALVGRGSCEFLVAGVEPLDELVSGRLTVTENATAEHCVLEQGDARVTVWWSSPSPGDDSPTEGTARRLGPLAAWENDTADSCTITTLVLPSYLLAVTYQDATPAAPHCTVDELITAAAVQTILDRTAS